MKKCKYILLLVVLLFVQTHYVLISASDIDLYNNRLCSPEVSNLFHCHLAETSLFTGRMNLSIPLYQLDDPDFPLSISLAYTADGFKPRKHSGVVGYNWVLDVGGCISRETNGHPDDCTIRLYNKVNNMGMLNFLRKETPNPDSIFNFSPSVFGEGGGCFKKKYDNTPYYIDYLPDIFNFDFCGHKGAFMIDNYGKPVIIKGDYVEVDLSELYQYIDEDYSQNMVFPDGNLGKITIRTLDGYSYEFGGDASSVGCSVQIFKESGNIEKLLATNNPIINSWFLKKIIAPNGRTLSFNYKPINQAIDISTPLWLYNEEYVTNHENEMIDPLDVNSFMHANPTNYECVSSITKECVLQSIQVTGPNPLTVYFYCQPESNSMYPISKYNLKTHSPLSRYNYQLDSLTVTSNNRTLRQVRFSYETKKSQDNSSSWRFLNSVNIRGLGMYSFEYNHNTYPSLNENTLESQIYNIDGYWLYNDQAGLLNTVVFPSGGKEIYLYGKHYVWFLRRYAEDWIISPDGATGNLRYKKTEAPGNRYGTRIETIFTYDEKDSLVSEKRYTYESGVYYDRHSIETNSSLLHRVDNLIAYNFNVHPVGYPKVIERIYSNNKILSKNVYHFAIDETEYSLLSEINIDTSSFKRADFTWREYYDEVSAFLMFNESLLTLGKLVGVEKFLNETTLLQTDCNYYNNTKYDAFFFHLPPVVPAFSSDTIVTYFDSWNFRLCRKLYIYPDVLNQKTNVTYQNKNILFQTEAFYHDEKQRITKQITFDSDNIEHFTYYRYPDELHAIRLSTDVSARALYMLTQKGQVAKPIETYSGVKMQNTEYVTSGSVTKYFTDLPFNHAVPAQWRNHHVYPSQVYSLALATPVSNYQPSYISVGLLKIDNHYQLSKSYQLDSLLRPISVTPVGGPTTTYTWNGFYPDSVTVGSQITTYTSIPHVGITSITDPKGLTTYYSYDAYGRLVEVYHMFDNVKQIINAYNYHISNE